MALTECELRVAADVAEKYPKGHGYAWFCDMPDIGKTEAAKRIADDPECLGRG